MSKNPSFTKMRVSSAFVQMKLENPFGILFTHIDRAADYTFKAEKLNQIRRVFKSPVLNPRLLSRWARTATSVCWNSLTSLA